MELSFLSCEGASNDMTVVPGLAMGKPSVQATGKH